MENQNQQNVSVSQGDELKDVMKMFSDYESSTEEKGGSTSGENILSKYFTPRNSVEKFRILPPLEGRDIIEHAFFHRVQVNAPNGQKRWRKVYCPAHNSPRVPKLDKDGNVITTEEGKPVMVNQKCPLCEKANSIRAKLDPSLKGVKKENYTDIQKQISEKNKVIYSELSKWEAKKYHIVRGIDKGNMKDGVKFWRFKDDYRKQGVLDRLIPALKMYAEHYKFNPTSIQNGSDLYINVVDSKLPNGATYKSVSSIACMPPSKLIDDDVMLNQWLNDNITWRDVFKEASMTRVLDSEQYLERVAKGTDPYWNDIGEDKKYIFPDPADAELMAKANERTESLDNSQRNIEMASDVNVVSASNIVGNSYGVDINNVTPEDVGTDVDNSVNVGAEFAEKSTQETPSTTQSIESESNNTTAESKPETVVQNMFDDEEFNVDDLPF